MKMMQKLIYYNDLDIVIKYDGLKRASISSK